MYVLTLFGQVGPFEYFIVLLLLYVLSMFLSLAFGVGAKRGIDIHATGLETTKVTVPIDEYEDMVVKHRDAYAHLYNKSGGGCLCFCFTFIFPFMVLLLNLIIDDIVIIGRPWDQLYVNMVLLILSSVIPYSIGFQMVNVDPEQIFKEPPSGDLFDYVEALSNVNGIEPMVEVTLGKSGDLLVIMDAEPKLKLTGFPDTVQVKVQASHSGFTYPYLVATIFKGPKVEKHVERIKKHRGYPILMEYMMDDEVTVLVARFDIPKRTSSVPHISNSAFATLAEELVETLRTMTAS